MYNPSLQQEPRYEPAKVVPLGGEPSMLEWLSTQGRLVKRDPEERQASIVAEDIDLLEIEGDYYEADDSDDDDFEIEEDEA